MPDFLAKLLQNQLFLLSLAVATGLLLGRARFRSLSLGTSGALFTGLALGLLDVKVSYEIFNWNLMLFVVAVGLLSAEDIVLVVKKYGMKFVVLGIVVTGVGALCTYVMAREPPWKPRGATRSSPSATRSPTPSACWRSSFSSSWPRRSSGST